VAGKTNQKLIKKTLIFVIFVPIYYIICMFFICIFMNVKKVTKISLKKNLFPAQKHILLLLKTKKNEEGLTSLTHN